MELKFEDVDDLCTGAAFWVQVAVAIPTSAG